LSEYAYYREPKVLGVDVARFGNDRSVVCRRQGPLCHGFDSYQGISTMELCSRILRIADEFHPQLIIVDSGGVGGGVLDRLQQLGANAVGVDFAQRASDAKYQNARMEIWAKMRDWLEYGVIPNDERLIADLCAPRYSFSNAHGRQQLESKDSMKRRGLPSPDVGDALAVTFAYPVLPGKTAGVGKCIMDDTPAWQKDTA